jgi:hypothetical protein
MSLSQIYGIDFTVRANQSPLSDGGQWQAVGAAAPLQILSGACTGTDPGDAFGEGALTGPTLPQDQYGQFTVGALSGGTPPSIVMWIRGNGTNPTSSDGYRRLTINQNVGSWAVFTRISGTPTNLGSGTTTINPGDVFTLEAQGNNVILIQNSTTLFSTTDTTVSSFTNQVLEINAPISGQVATITTYAAGGFVTPPPPPSVYSQPDCRDFAHFPNTAINVQGTETYTVPSVDSRAGGAPVDSRAGGAPAACGVYPQNSRTPGTFGPDE